MLKPKLSKATNLPFVLTTGSSLSEVGLATSAACMLMSTGFWASTVGPNRKRRLKENAAIIKFREGISGISEDSDIAGPLWLFMD